ncbi:D.miranda DNA sequence of the trim transposon [Plakobranchus ocellatus]|uniref:D.miranda DNA sequence of the trim transposon n=1 Tax=Plakobranchus ocellatus TaxID=259542 RepID=A0AAV4C4T8_9GAST|nr:D.miranda DNA sequence of the trim transposon [Plakobranchus ocellatus]
MLFFIDDSKLEENVPAAAYFPEHPDRSKATRLRDGASVFSAELEGIALALTEIKKSLNTIKTLFIYSNSLSALQAIQSTNFKVKDIRCLYNLIRKFSPYVHISFVWMPAQIDIRRNENMDKLANAALNKASCSGRLICWSDLKPEVTLASTTFGKKIGMLRGQTSSTKYSPTWEKTSAKEVKEQVENGRR